MDLFYSPPHAKPANETGSFWVSKKRKREGKKSQVCRNNEVDAFQVLSFPYSRLYTISYIISISIFLSLGLIMSKTAANRRRRRRGENRWKVLLRKYYQLSLLLLWCFVCASEYDVVSLMKAQVDNTHTERGGKIYNVTIAQCQWKSADVSSPRCKDDGRFLSFFRLFLSFFPLAWLLEWRDKQELLVKNTLNVTPYFTCMSCL